MAFDEPLVPRPVTGRRFQATRRVRLGDVGPKGRLRLDALARYLQDVSNDDAMDSGIEDAMAWVVRRTRVEVAQFPIFREDLRLTTWCSGIGARWAARRVDVDGAAGGSIRCEALWVHLDLDRGTPRKLPASFHQLFAPAAAGRTVRARLHHGPPPPDASLEPWPLRFADMDLMGHVNNAISWAVVEEVLSSRAELRAPGLRAEVEHPGPIDPGQDVAVATGDTDSGFACWTLADGVVASTAVVEATGHGSGVSS